MFAPFDLIPGKIHFNKIFKTKYWNKKIVKERNFQVTNGGTWIGDVIQSL